MKKTLIATDRETAPKPEVKPTMEPTPGGGGTLTTKELITTIAVILGIILLIVLSVYFYNRFRKAKMTVTEN